MANMKNSDKGSALSRREAIRNSLLIGAAVMTPGLLALGCSKKEEALTCTDTTGLSEQDIATRKALEYVDKAPDPAKDCVGCQLYTAGAPNACGTCSIIKGPIHPKGHCKSWVAKQG